MAGMTKPTLATTAALAIGLACSVLGCGGSASEAAGSDAAGADDGREPDAAIDAGAVAPPMDGAATDAPLANGDAALSDAGAFTCGDSLCDPSQICLYPAYGCVAELPPDAGVCPDGAEYSDASGICAQTPPTPSCVSLSPGEGSFDCSGGVGGSSCSTVNAPIPGGCSRICRAICA
jgi:hypothetical protein